MGSRFECRFDWLRPIGDEQFHQLILLSQQLELPLLLMIGTRQAQGEFWKLWGRALDLGVAALRSDGLDSLLKGFSRPDSVRDGMSAWGEQSHEQGMEFLLAALIEQVVSEPELDDWHVAKKFSGIPCDLPAISAAINEEGLLPLDGAFVTDGDGVVSDGYRVSWHRRIPDVRGFKSGSDLGRVLVGAAGDASVRVSIAPDPFMYALESQLPELMLRDHWYGKPFSREDLDDPFATGVTVYLAPADISRNPRMYSMCKMGGILRLEVRWSHKQGLKTLEIEEIKERRAVPGRYIHAQYSLAESRFIHIDGAVMHYGEDIQTRIDNIWGLHGRPVRALVKPKLFRVDGAIQESLVWDTICYFLRGNPLIFEYLSGDDCGVN